MAELFERIRSRGPQGPLLLFSLAFLLLVVSIALALSVSNSKSKPGEEPSQAETAPPSPSPPQPEESTLLVTADQIARLSYTDSVLGTMSWSLTEESLYELNQTLVRYNIISDEEICHFLAQATVETGAGRELTETGDEAYFQKRGYTTGTRGAGYLHLTHMYGQMAFATWMMKRYVPSLNDIQYVSPASYGEEDIAAAYYAALQTAANMGLNISRYSRIVYDPDSTLITGADYIAENFAWESAGYYWMATGIGEALSSQEGKGVDAASTLVGGSNWQSRREAYAAFYPVLTGTG